MRISDWSSDVCSSDLVIPGDRLEPEFVELVLGNDEARRCGVILLARIAGGDDAAFERAQLAERFQRRVGTIALVVRVDDRIALLLRHRYRNQLEIGGASCRERVWK